MLLAVKKEYIYQSVKEVRDYIAIIFSTVMTSEIKLDSSALTVGKQAN